MFKRFIFKNFALPVARIYWRVFKPKTYGSRAIVLSGDSILLIKNLKASYWHLPGGKIEKNETPGDCVIREIGEELSLINPFIDYKLGEYVSKREGKRDTVYIYVVKTESQSFKKQWELDDAKWFLLSEIPENLGDSTSRRMQEFFSGHREVRAEW